MSNDPPYQHPPTPESERTIVRPRPGARAGTAGTAATPPAPATIFAAPTAGQSREPTAESVPVGSTLASCAQPLLSLAAQLRTTPAHADPAGLKESLSQGVRDFEQTAQRAGVAREAIVAARYILCTALDEAVTSTPWGSSGAWASDTLLVRFHNETWGGEKVFLLLSKLAEEPAKNRELLEMVYLSLTLGFEGRYGVLPGGRAQLDQIRERLHRMLRDLQPLEDRALSARWAPASLRQRRWLSTAPFWAFCALMALIAVGVYMMFTLLLGAHSDPAFAAIQSIRLPAVAPLPAQPPPPAAQNRLAKFLEAEIREGLVTVRDEATRSVVSIRGDGFFEPGSAVVAERVRPILDRIGTALAANPGRVMIAGHTDSQPIRTPRYPSNWELSKDRAQSVRQMLTAKVAADRMQAEGRADAEPLAPNDAPAGRARNRRVEVTLFVSN